MLAGVQPSPPASSIEPGLLATYQGCEYPTFFRGEKLPWLSITYPSFLDNRLARSLWLHLLCPRGLHLFDEVHSIEFGHSVSCDACSLSVNISPEPTLEETLAREAAS